MFNRETAGEPPPESASAPTQSGGEGGESGLRASEPLTEALLGEQVGDQAEINKSYLATWREPNIYLIFRKLEQAIAVSWRTLARIAGFGAKEQRTEGLPVVPGESARESEESARRGDDSLLRPTAIVFLASAALTCIALPLSFFCETNAWGVLFSVATMIGGAGLVVSGELAARALPEGDA